MSRYGLSVRIRLVRKTKPCAEATKASLPDNLLNRMFEATHPMLHMVTDVIYVPYFEDGEWWCGYLSLVQNLFDRSIVARVFSRRQDTSLGLATLQLLSHRDRTEGAMLHSYLGNIYTAQVFMDAVEGMRMTQSFSRTANSYDDATMSVLTEPSRRKRSTTRCISWTDRALKSRVTLLATTLSSTSISVHVR